MGAAGYEKYATFHTKTSFGVGTMSFGNLFNEYLDIYSTGEKFEFFPPNLTFHGLITGHPYIDINCVSTLKNLENDSFATIRYQGRGWR
jgi:hypothetical protein